MLDNERLKPQKVCFPLRKCLQEAKVPVISLDELLPLNLLDLKEKVSGLSLELELPSAPLREEIIDLLLDKCFEEKKPVRIAGIIQVMEDGHGFILQEKKIGLNRNVLCS